MSSDSGSAPPESLIYGNSVLSIISFCFTFLTFLRVIWSSLETLWTPARSIQLALANTKATLYEEREQTRRAAHDAHHFGRQLEQRRRRRSNGAGRSEDSGGASRLVTERASRVLAESVKQVCRRFRDLEAPFLRAAVDVGKGSDHFNGGREYGISEFGGFEGDYCTITMYHRFVWLRQRSKLIDLMDGLQRLQVRRIGIEVSALGRYGSKMRRMSSF